VRVARDFGTVSALYPEGVDDLLDLPHALFDNIVQATVVLGWRELPEDEQPPKRIWLDTDKLREHFAWVKRKREAEIKGDKAIDDPVDNEAGIKDLIVG
jgi:hypothetical protein